MANEDERGLDQVKYVVQVHLDADVDVDGAITAGGYEHTA